MMRREKRKSFRRSVIVDENGIAERGVGVGGGWWRLLGWSDLLH